MATSSLITVVNYRSRLARVTKELVDALNTTSGHTHDGTNSASLAAAGGTLDQAYDQGGAGSGRSITVDTGAVTLTVPNASNNVALALVQNDVANNPAALTITNTGTGNDVTGNGGNWSVTPAGVATFDSISAGQRTFVEDVLPAGTVVYAGRDNTGDLTLNALVGKEVHIAIAGTDVLDIGVGVEVISGGLTVTAGGLTVSASGANITGGLTTDTLTVSGAHTFGGQVTMNNGLDVNGTTITMDVDGDSSIAMGTDDQLTVTLNSVAYVVVTTTTLDINALELIMDADADSSLTMNTDDQLDIRLNAADEYVLTAALLDVTGANIGNIGGAAGASAGALRMANNVWLAARNQAGGGDINAIKVNTTDFVQIGTASFEVATANLVTVTVTNPGAARTYTIPDGGGASTFAFSNVAQTISGVYSFTAAPTFTVAGLTATFTNSNDGASSQVAVLQGDRATPADGDAAYVTFRLSDSAGNQDEVARITWAHTTVLDGATQDGDLVFSALVNNVLTTMLTLDGSTSRIVPAVGINAAGITSPDLGIVTTIDINGGTIAGVTIDGASSASANLTLNDSVTLGFGTADAESTISSNGSDTIWQMVNGGLTIGLTAAAPSPDNNGLHIWRGSAGAAAGDGSTTVIIEHSATQRLMMLAPDNVRQDLAMGGVTSATRGMLSYYNAGATPADTWAFWVADVEELYIQDGVMEFQSSFTIRRVTVAGAAANLTYDIPVSGGGAANAVVRHTFHLDGGASIAGLYGETDGAGSITAAKSVWIVPYVDAGAGAIGPTAPTTGATWNGGLFLGASDAVPNGRLYWYANAAVHYVDATAGFSYLYEEPETFGNFNHDGKQPWGYGDLMILKVDRYTEDGGHALPYPLDNALHESEYIASLEERVKALEEANAILRAKVRVA